MKRYLFSTVTLFYSLIVFSQDKTVCERIVATVIQCINQQNTEDIKPHLSENFSISGHTSPMAEKILAQLVSQLGIVKSFNQTSVENSTPLTLNYDIDYEKFGNKKAFFEFDKNNKIIKMELLKIEVKTAKSDESKINYTVETVTEIPFTTMKDLIVVKAFFAGQERDFILDTGSKFTLINSKYINNNTDSENVLSSIKSIHNENVSEVNIIKTSIDFYGIGIREQDILTFDISHLEFDNRKIYGLIGYDFLKKYDILFDYSQKRIVLIHPDYFPTYKEEKLNQKDIESIAIELDTHIPVLKVNINGSYYKMGVDSGATANLLDINLLPKLKTYLKHTTTDYLSGASKSRKEVSSAQIKKFYVGTTPYKNMQTVFSNISHLNKNEALKIDGILGYKFLSKQLTLLSYQRKEILLIK